MKRIDVLVLDDNLTIGSKVKTRLFNANNYYKHDSGIEIFPHYLNIDNHNVGNAAKSVNDYIIENDIAYLLVDRGFGTIINPSMGSHIELDQEYLYKDNNISGYYIEELLFKIKKSSVNKVKGVIVYTYDDYRELDKQGETIKEEIIDKLKDILPSKCKIDVLLAYSDIYKIAGVDLYEGYEGSDLVRLGKKKDFVLYGIFVGELLYHKLLQMINIRNLDLKKDKQQRALYRWAILYLIFISLNVGANAICSYLLDNNNVAILIAALVIGLVFPIAILLLKPALLIDIEE